MREEWVLISDVHLNELKPRGSEEEGTWWAYKAKEASQDEALAAFMRAIDARRPAYFQRSVLLFNGDTFDFDTCFSTPTGEPIPPEGLPPTEAQAVFRLGRILEDHPCFVRALAAFCAQGNRAVFVYGNHDRELHFPGVQGVLRRALAQAAPAGMGAELAARVSFVPWFVHVPGTLYVEHGNQYDATCSYRDVLRPTVPAWGGHEEELETPFGSLLARHTLGRLGTFNPYNDESFILSLGGYLKHWRQHYFGRRPFFSAYFRATWHTVRELRARRRRYFKATKVKQAPTPEEMAQREYYRAYAREQAVPDAFVEQQLRLTGWPIADRLRLLLHEVWIDRFAFLFGAILVFVIGLSLAKSWFHYLFLTALLPLFYLGFRAMGRGSLALQERARWGLVAEAIGKKLQVPVVAFGHSHRPERRPLRHGGRYYNLGSWAPVLPEDEESSLMRARRYLIVRRAASGEVYVVFSRWNR